MHTQAFDFVARTVQELHITSDLSAVEIGGRNVNGSVRDLFGADYTAVDQWPGEGVDIVADGAEWEHERLYDVAVSTEVLEHAERWQAIVMNMADAVRPGGFLIFTCATDPRLPHSAVDGGGLREGEYYGNVGADELAEILEPWCSSIHTETHVYDGHGGDLYCYAVLKGGA